MPEAVGVIRAPDRQRTRRAALRAIAHNCAPAALTSAGQLLAAVVVTGLVGHMTGSALYIRAVYLSLALVFTAVIVAFSVPLQVAVARSRGRGEEADQSARIAASARMIVVAIVVLAGCAGLLAGELARVAAMPASLVPELRQFIVLMVAAQLFGALGELGAATLRGSGRAVLGTCLTMSLAIINVGLVALLGLRREWGLDALPVASATAGLVEVLGAGYLLRRLGLLDLRRLGRRDPQMRRTTLQIGVPIAASFLVLFVESLLLLHVVAGYGGRQWVEGFSSALSVQDVIVLPAVGFGSGLAVLINSRTGDRFQVYRLAFAVLAATYLVLTIALVWLAEPLADLMVADDTVARHAGDYLQIVGPSLGLTALTIAALTVLEEIGFGVWAVALNLTFLTVVVGVGWVTTATSGSLNGLFVTILVAGLVAGLTIPFLAYGLLRRLEPEAS